MPVIYRPFLEKLGGETSASSYVGNEGELFYDPGTTTLRISDGSTPGGQVVSVGGGDSSNVLTDGVETLTLSVDTLTYSGEDLDIVNDTNNGITLSQYDVSITSTGVDDDDNPISATWKFSANGTVILPPESNFNSESGTISIGTTDLSGGFARGSFIELYDTSNTNSWFVATARDNNSHTASFTSGANSSSGLLYAAIETYDGGVDYGTTTWKFDKSGKTTFPLAIAPTTSVGESGDVAGMMVLTQDYLYFCVQTYDGASDIWKRIAWPNDTW